MKFETSQKKKDSGKYWAATVKTLPEKDRMLISTMNMYSRLEKNREYSDLIKVFDRLNRLKK